MVRLSSGTPVRISDVADVSIGAKPRFGTASVNAEPAVVLSIQKQPNANTLELTKRIDEELDRLKASLPEGIAINRGIFRQADFISLAVDNVFEALRDGALLVVIILFLFLWNFRTTLISIVAIPLSLAVAVITMKLLEIAEKIRNTVIDTPLGARVELAWLAEIAEDRGPNTISRETSSAFVSVRPA